MTVVMFCLREPPPRDEQPMMAARALATLRAHFVRPTRRLRRWRIFFALEGGGLGRLVPFSGGGALDVEGTVTVNCHGKI